MRCIVFDSIPTHGRRPELALPESRCILKYCISQHSSSHKTTRADASKITFFSKALFFTDFQRTSAARSWCFQIQELLKRIKIYSTPTRRRRPELMLPESCVTKTSIAFLHTEDVWSWCFQNHDLFGSIIVYCIPAQRRILSKSMTLLAKTATFTTEFPNIMLSEKGLLAPSGHAFWKNGCEMSTQGPHKAPHKAVSSSGRLGQKNWWSSIQ